jgi:uncharacterized alkaline shock family protein YloU
MNTELRSPGKTTVAPDVLLTIAKLTALKVSGVVGMTSARRTTRGGHIDEGVHLSVDGTRVDVDLFLILDKGVNLRQVSREVQDQVARAISEMVGMKAGRINVHIEDIDYPTAS